MKIYRVPQEKIKEFPIFRKQLKMKEEMIIPDAQTVNAQATEIPDMVVTENDIKKTIDELSQSSAAGPDGFQQYS